MRTEVVNAAALSWQLEWGWISRFLLILVSLCLISGVTGCAIVLRPHPQGAAAKAAHRSLISGDIYDSRNDGRRRQNGYAGSARWAGGIRCANRLALLHTVPFRLYQD